MEDQLTLEERQILLQLARQTLTAGVCHELLPILDLKTLPERLQAPGASFVTLTRWGELRGCIGALEAVLPLAEDVCEHAVAAGLQDYRFPPMSAEELPEVTIEISRLTSPVKLIYKTPQELLVNLRPGIDGVILREGLHRATFLPQVWEKLPSPVDFLSHLCLKMGAPADYWRRRVLDVSIYQVEEFHEPGFKAE